MTWGEKIVASLILLWVLSVALFMIGDIKKGLRSKKDMAQYPTPRSEYMEMKEALTETQHLRNWVQYMYPQVYAEWKAVRDVERSVEGN